MNYGKQQLPQAKLDYTSSKYYACIQGDLRRWAVPILSQDLPTGPVLVSIYVFEDYVASLEHLGFYDYYGMYFLLYS